MSQTDQQVIAVVLESAEVSLISRWCDEGKLPAMQRLREQGVWCELTGPGYISSGCVWPTLCVGTNPAKHGIGFFHRELKNGTYRMIKKYADQVVGEYFWDSLAKAGHRVAILDAALTKPTPGVNGVILCDWGSEHPGWKQCSEPPELFADVSQRFGEHPLADWYQRRLHTVEEWRELSDKLIQGAQIRTDIFCDMIARSDSRFALANYSEPHWAGHMCWHLHDPDHPEYDADLVAKVGDVILDSYRACDRGIAQIVERFPDANMVVLSLIGMGSHAGGEMLLPEILDRLGMAGKGPARNSPREPGGSRRALFGNTAATTQIIQRVEQVISPDLMRRVKNAVPERLWDTVTRGVLSVGTNWKNSIAFSVPGDNSGLIRINLKGREPKGKVEPGREFDAVCEQLITAFKELRDVSTGKPAVTDVYKLRDLLKGPLIDELPDLVVLWQRGVPISAVESERLGRIELEEFHKRPGGHWHSGFLMASGHHFKRGEVLPTANLLDVAPTMLALFDVEAPQEFDGEVMRGMLRA